jgi:hypothetical protein
MKFTKTIFAIAIASTFLVTSCREAKKESTDDHGHEHNEDGSHMHEEDIEQEEFEVGKDSMGTIQMMILIPTNTKMVLNTTTIKKSNTYER